MRKKLDKLDLRTYHQSITKTEIGYTFKRHCKQKDCGAEENLKLNVSNGIGEISFEEKCKQPRH